jgi:uncharacterized protein RhaS with RHS repeats
MRRWLTKDPIGFASADSNFYIYADNDLVNELDPSGLAHYVVVVGDPGLNEHNTGDLFQRAADTKAAELRDAGNDVSVIRVSNVSQFNAAITSGPAIDGGIYSLAIAPGINFTSESNLHSGPTSTLPISAFFLARTSARALPSNSSHALPERRVQIA